MSILYGPPEARDFSSLRSSCPHVVQVLYSHHWGNSYAMGCPRAIVTLWQEQPGVIYISELFDENVCVYIDMLASSEMFPHNILLFPKAKESSDLLEIVQIVIGCLLSISVSSRGSGRRTLRQRSSSICTCRSCSTCRQLLLLLLRQRTLQQPSTDLLTQFRLWREIHFSQWQSCQRTNTALLCEPVTNAKYQRTSANVTISTCHEFHEKHLYGKYIPLIDGDFVDNMSVDSLHGLRHDLAGQCTEERRWRICRHCINSRFLCNLRWKEQITTYLEFFFESIYLSVFGPSWRTKELQPSPALRRPRRYLQHKIPNTVRQHYFACS